MIRAVIFDLDGVIRHFDPETTADIERRRGVASGTIASVAFAKTRIEPLTTGRLSRADWIASIGEALGDPAAAVEWGMQPVRLDAEVLALARQLSGAGIRPAILTNGTDTISAETTRLGLTALFEPIINTAEIGFAKPDARAFFHVLDALRCEPGDAFFTDDSATNVAAAAALGMHAHHFRSASGLRAALGERGVTMGEEPVSVRS
ncbi:HAD-IA family hydrolase [Microbacterium sp. NPDC058342]|uniref:HAD-IA family hydrolase n=1 Tax=Microbacterium sp. NPDC058342 TaxID=3346454 RepID=UPI0036643829